MTDAPFHSDNISDYDDGKADAADFELRTQPKLPLTINRNRVILAFGLIVLMAIVLFSYAIDRSMPDATDGVVSPQGARKNIQRGSLNDSYTELPNNYSDAVAYVKEKTRKMLRDNKTGVVKRADLPLAMLGKRDLDLVKYCHELLSDIKTTPNQRIYCQDVIKVAYTESIDKPTNSTPNNGVTTPGTERPKPHNAVPLKQRNSSNLVDMQLENKLTDEEQAAMDSDIMFSVSNTSLSAAPPNANDGDATNKQLMQLASIPMPTMPAGGQSDQNLQGEKRQFVKDGAKNDDVYLDHRLITPRSPYQVMAGTLIPIVLKQGINSDLPGDITALVRENVYDTVTGNHLLIPQGTTVFGLYDSIISYGQKRLLIIWTRIIRPDGSSILLDGMKGVDMSGLAGVAGDVDNHWGRIIGGVILSSILSVATATSQGDKDNATFSQDAARSVGEGINQSGQRILERNINIQPTISIPAGERANIVVNKDIVLTLYEKNQSKSRSAEAVRIR